MELKLRAVDSREERERLLIVPYGIETLMLHDVHQRRAALLIVPYGIETTIERS